MTGERVLQKQKAAQTPAVAKIQQASYKGISSCVKLHNVLVLHKGNGEVMFTAMKINTEFQIFKDRIKYQFISLETLLYILHRFLL